MLKVEMESDIDKKLNEENLKFFIKADLPYIERLKKVPVDCDTSLSQPEEYLKAAIRSVFVSYLFYNYKRGIPKNKKYQSNKEMFQDIYSEFDSKFFISKYLNTEVYDLYNSFFNDYKKGWINNNIVYYYESFECAYVYLWILGIIKNIHYEKLNDAQFLYEFILSKDYESLKSCIKMRSKYQILCRCNFVFRLAWALERAKNNNYILPINEVVVKKQKHTFAKALNWESYSNN